MSNVHRERGEHAAHYLIEHRFPCTALAAGTDACALAAMQVVRPPGTVFPTIWQWLASTISLRRSMPARRLQRCAASSMRLAAPPPYKC